MDKNKLDQNVQKAIADITKKFGEEAIAFFDRENLSQNIKTIPSGSYLLDDALGIGGYPEGRIIEIFGPESGGKTTLCLHAIAQVQKRGGVAAFIDAEHAIDPNYAVNLGIDLDKLIISQPDSGEQAMDIVDMLAKSGVIDLIVVDSVAALVPEAELNGEMSDNQIGLQARLMSKSLRKITATLNKTHTTVIFVNQIREKIGVMFGNPETTTGGRALKFYSSIRLEVRRVSSIAEGKEIVGNDIKIKVVKNKLAPPFKSFQTEIIFGQGIDALGELIELACVKGVIEKKGSWYAYNGENLCQGKKALKDFLRQNEEFKNEIKNKINSIE
ncbi:RecA protein [Mycoplasmopsis californica HAZ160_1]|uniref:Protein RecA n=1 Tax=Mycoplasmopsis californica HAZ160_1 TaxID=1397850 RepID=A0AAT9F7T9_9BACT|nr:recombinase RecA [Mycoplasmopsis californica]BAP00941.1 RecA protein [Mycoplasmopsis californica HAZ160_1]BBG40803.1 RecA protein [Mycoplasmopsis californica]BBG41397.1 RecA protein [Mycoplasmopsis californica]BBG41990.1 RecA protein [Mycoplasmopsis californica]BBG42576.1 RecA protein [Mycoplasmopsis californica]